MQENQEDEAILDVAPQGDVPLATIVPNLDGLQCDVQVLLVSI